VARRRHRLQCGGSSGLAPDGGLYVPVTWPRLAPPDFEGASDLAGVAARLLAPFVAGDPLAPMLSSVAAEAFSFPAPLVSVEAQGRLSVLELFHGPTAAFKDFGARFLAACFARLRGRGERALTILVATSGDTGGAVAAAFHERAGVEVAVLFPKGLVSRRSNASSPAGAVMSGRWRFAARSMTASAW